VVDTVKDIINYCLLLLAYLSVKGVVKNVCRKKW
jgi:hypothetical protein